MIVSLHTPKSGGTSFKSLLENHFGESLKEDYKDVPINTPLDKRIRNVKDFDVKFKLYLKKYYYLKGVECIHGHFLPFKYKSLLKNDNNKFITWLRDPLERLGSHYYYWQRSYRGQKSGILHQKVINEEWDFEKFCFSDEMRNFYSQFLYKFPIENFDFIGITEYFNDDCRYFAKRYLKKQNISISTKLSNPNKKNSYFIDKSFKKDLIDFHYEDMKIYEYALNLRNKRINDITST